MARYSRSAGKDVERAMKREKKGTLKRGKGGRGGRALHALLRPLLRLRFRADFSGTFFPFLRASENPIAIACLRLFAGSREAQWAGSKGFHAEPRRRADRPIVTCASLW